MQGKSRQQHHDLLRAAKLRDLTGAEAILAQHINQARDLLISHLRQVDIDQAPERSVSAPAATSSRPASQRRMREANALSRFYATPRTHYESIVPLGQPARRIQSFMH